VSTGEPGPAPLSIAQALAQAGQAGVDRLDGQLLLAQLLQRPRAWLIAHDDEALAPAVAEAFRHQTARRADGVPLAYLLGEREFHGLRLQVTPDVLDPRPDTETLVDWALQRLAAAARPSARVLDLGTGSGAIALAVAAASPSARVHASDASPAALAVAQANALRLGLPLQARAGSWWQPWAGERFELVLSNPPYIAEGDPHLPALRHEPLQALVAGADGLDDIRRIVAGAGAHLAPGAWLLLEHGWDQAAAVQSLLHAAGFQQVQGRQDLAGHVRCSGGRWPG
jgi:release factor glutamine methyltransferase